MELGAAPMKVAEAKFCCDPECEEVVALEVDTCPACTQSQFILLASLTDPQKRDWVKRKLHRNRAKVRLLRMVKSNSR